MIKLKEGGLVDRIVSVYGRCPPSSKGNLCKVFWRGVLGIIIIVVICCIPTFIVLADLSLYFNGELDQLRNMVPWVYQIDISFFRGCLIMFFGIGMSVSILVQGFILGGIILAPPLYLLFLLLDRQLPQWLINVGEVYSSVKNKYCPTVVWVKKEDK